MNFKDLVGLDCETYPNYFLLSFKEISSGQRYNYECRGADSRLSDKQIVDIKQILRAKTSFGFNSNNFDMPIIMLALSRATAGQLNKMCDWIINTENSQGWKTMRHFNLEKLRRIDHIDIMQVTPGVGGTLKLFGARMQTQNLQNIPIEPGKVLTSHEMDEILRYCDIDVDVTAELCEKLVPQLQLRETMGVTYDADFRSKSDAQIAETIFRKKFEVPYDDNPKIPKSVKFEPASYLKFISPELNATLKLICDTDFQVSEAGKVEIPEQLKIPICIGETEYQLGVGGIHSKDKCMTVTPGKGQHLIEKDVSSHYPSIILSLGLVPPKLGDGFLREYRTIYNQRLNAKKQGDKSTSNSLKIVINGSFGKLGSKWSCLYAPKLLISVTLTGQLTLLMLIERLELAGIQVVSSNTDAFVSLVTDSQMQQYERMCAEWEKEIGLQLDMTEYSGLYAMDVNNYFALTTKGEIKRKGQFTLPSLSKNPKTPICTHAIVEFIKSGKLIRETIRECTDITQFLFVRTVNGNAMWGGFDLGKVVRWYKVKEGGTITYKTNGNKVPNSDNSQPLMQLIDWFPTDTLDYEWYINEAYKLLDDTGYTSFD